jgi:hypothetical protein
MKGAYIGRYVPKTDSVAVKSNQFKAPKAVAAFDALIADSVFDPRVSSPPRPSSRPETSFKILWAASQA